MELFQEVLLNPDITQPTVEINHLRLNREKVMSRFCVTKTALSDIFLKMRVLDDKIRTEPLKRNGDFI